MPNTASVISAAVTAAGSIASLTGGSTGAVASQVASAATAAANALQSGNQMGVIADARVYWNSGTLLGKAAKVTGLGMPKPKTAEVKPLGYLAPMKVFAGFEQPEVTIDWTSLYGDISLALFNPLAVQRFQVRTSQAVHTANGVTSAQAVVADIHGYVTSNSDPSIESGAAANFNSKINVTYSKLTVGSTVCYECDYVNNVFKVAGIDVIGDITNNM